MKFYFPDSQDLISPTYDFAHDEYSPLRVRQRDDRYAHEVLVVPPYDGVLVSKAIVDGSVRGAGKYSMPQRERMYRYGVRKFFRLPDSVSTMGDCGSFNYVSEPSPPFTVEEVLHFYEECGFDAGVSVDHVILGYQRPGRREEVPADWHARRQMSLELADEFIKTIRRRRSRVLPIGAAQGWDPESYTASVRELQEMGYQRIALGGMVPLKTPDILDCLGAIDGVRKAKTELHLLGVTRVTSMDAFASFGVTSFDSTSAFRQSFMDDRDNYHTIETTYVAVRIPQVDANVTLKRAILAGTVSQRDAILTERECLIRLRRLNDGTADVDEALEVIADYERITAAKTSYIEDYRRTLSDRPWERCDCTLCQRHGVEIVIFRGTERNKRRGFHNLSVLAAKMRALPNKIAA
jgi:queuine/archaeosine tRNA-ribosyltransferase